MTREDLDFISSMNMCDEIGNEAYKKIMCHCEEQEPCEDAISRQAVLRLVEQYPSIIGNRCVGLMADIKHLPPVTPSRPKGKWINNNNDDAGEGYFICSKCKSDVWDVTDYCPNCGADMRESEE